MATPDGIVHPKRVRRWTVVSALSQSSSKVLSSLRISNLILDCEKGLGDKVFVRTRRSSKNDILAGLACGRHQAQILRPEKLELGFRGFSDKAVVRKRRRRCCRTNKFTRALKKDMRIATRKKQRLAGVENGADGVIMNPRHAPNSWTLSKEVFDVTMSKPKVWGPTNTTPCAYRNDAQKRTFRQTAQCQKWRKSLSWSRDLKSWIRIVAVFL